MNQFFSDVSNVFFSPAAAFDSVAKRPQWVLPILVLIGCSIALQLAVPEEFLREQMEQTVEATLPEDVSQSDLEAVVEARVDFTTTWGPIFIVILTPISSLVVASLLMLLFNVVMGGSGHFKQVFSATVLANYILLLGAVVAQVLIRMGAPNPILSPGLLLPEGVSGFTADFLNVINVFAVWMCGVLGVAMSRIYPGRSAWTGACFLLTLYLLMQAVMAVITGIFSG